MEQRGTTLLAVSPEAQDPVYVLTRIQSVEAEHKKILAPEIPQVVRGFDPREAGVSKGIQVKYGKGDFAITNAFYEMASKANAIVVQPKAQVSPQSVTTNVKPEVKLGVAQPKLVKKELN